MKRPGAEHDIDVHRVAVGDRRCYAGTAAVLAQAISTGGPAGPAGPIRSTRTPSWYWVLMRAFSSGWLQWTCRLNTPRARSQRLASGELGLESLGHRPAAAETSGHSGERRHDEHGRQHHREQLP